MDIPKDGEVVVTKDGGRHSFVLARFDLIPPESLKLIAQCLGYGALKHGEGNWLNISIDDHVNHALNHLNEFRLGADDEPHVVNAAVRTIFALTLAIQAKKQAKDYVHPDMVKVDLAGLNTPTGESGILNAVEVDNLICVVT